MQDIFFRSVSQGLQAFLPVAYWMAYAERQTSATLRRITLAAAGTALVLTLPTGQLFRNSSLQARWEFVLALMTAAFVWMFLARVRPDAEQGQPLRSRREFGVAVTAFSAVALVIVRQTMEIAAVALTALELRSETIVPIGIATILTLAAAIVTWAVVRRLSQPALYRSVTIAAWLSLIQTIFYAFHEAAEARVLPWSEVLHTATEPYGPDGIYGRHVSSILIVGPLLAAAWVKGRDRFRNTATAYGRTVRRLAALAATGAIALSAVLVVMIFGRTSSPVETAGVPAAQDLQRTLQQPHLLFRHTASDRSYGHLAAAPLTTPQDRALSELSCERVAYSAGHGICLVADRGVFTTYRAVLFDRVLKTTATLKLTGLPSRARVSQDGRVGVFTVFVSGDGYSTTTFSTRTMLVDMESGDILGNLEDFSVWRDGKRIKAADFNFWGVTFASDNNAFYATLKTAGVTHLVRGELALRRVTVLRDGVECPALSPDGQTIAFKKKMGTAAGAWRLYLLDVKTLAERPLTSETRFVDDQVEWLDPGHVLYGIPRPNSGTTDVFVAPIDGSTPASVFVSEASSPTVVR